MDIERLAPYFLLPAAVLALVGWVWLLAAAFRTHRNWGILVLLVVTAPLFILFRWKKAARPAGVLLLAGAAGAVPLAVNFYVRHFVPLAPYERMVEGERHLTLTGLEDLDYALIRSKPDVAVLQMANPDVTDETLDNLDGLPHLRELDLDNTGVTDAGLAQIAKLPALKILRLGNTRITDAGFRRHLMGKESLENLNLVGTQVASKTVREWKAGRPDRKALK